MTDNIIVNKEIDVVHLHSDTDLTIETNTQIRFSTSNILINYIPFDQYIRKVVFDQSYTSVPVSEMNDNSWSESVNISDTSSLINLNNNNGETIVNEVHTSGVSATHSHINSKHHYINISANNNIIFQNNTNSENIAFKKYTDSFLDQLTSLSNYVYEVINGNFMTESDIHTLPTITSGSHDITTLGTYVGNKLTTTKLTTIDVNDGVNEPLLNFDSTTAVNMVSSANSGIDVGSNIMLGTVNLLDLVKSQLDETGQIIIEATMSSGQDIGMTLTSLTHSNGYSFTYNVVFYLYEHDNTSPYPDTMILSGVKSTLEYTITIPVSVPVSVPLNLDLGYFTGLDAGKFYTVLGTFTNTRTDTVVENIEVTGGQNIATIMNIVITSVIVKNESEITISFIPHNTVVTDWTSSGKQIKFSVGIEDYSEEVDTIIRQNMSQSPSDQSSKTYDLSLSSIGGYDNDSILRVNESKRTTAHTINVISNHVEGGTFEMSQSLALTPFTFSAPSYAPTLSINYGLKQFTWTHTNNSADRLSSITFELFKGTTHIQDNTNTSYTITSSSIGTWKVRAKNVYGQSSAYSNEQNIVNPSFNIGLISANGNRTFNIGISNVNANGTHTLSGSYLKSTSSSSSITTNILNSAGTYTFTVTLTDQLNLSTNMTSSQLSITIKSPTVSLGSSFTYSETSLRYYVTVSVSNANSSWSITSKSISGGSSLSVDPANNPNKIYVTFPANYTGGSKYVSVTITDLYGYTASLDAYIDLQVSFTGGTTPSTSVSLSGTTIEFTSGLTPYQWYLNGSPISGATSRTFSMSTSHFGSIYCVATETNAQGFTRTITSDTTTNTEPTISNGNFTDINLSTIPIYQFSRTLGSDTTEVSVEMTPTLFNGAGTYTLKGTYENGYGLQKEITIGTFTATAPTIPSITSATSVSYDSITINYDLGTNGTPSVTPIITLFYGTSSGSEDSYMSLSSGSTSTNITGLLVGTTYYFKIKKVYQYYNTILSSNFDETTLDYQYDSEELVRLTLQSGGFFGMTDDEDKLYVYSLLDGPIRISESVLSGRIKSVYRGDNRPYDKLQISIWDVPEKRILLEKGAGNNVFYIVFDGNYLSYDSSSSALTTSSVKDSTCKFIIEAFPFTYTDNKFQDQQYNLDNYKAYLEPTNNTRLFKSYYQAFSVKTNNEGHSVYRNQDYPYSLVVDTDTNHVLKSQFLMYSRQDTFKNYQWFFFERQGFGIRSDGTTDSGFRLIENVKFPLSNLGKIHIVFENIYIRILDSNFGFNTINTGENNYNISLNTDIHIGPLHLNEVIVFHGNTWGIRYFALYNIYEYVNEQNESLGTFLTKANITNDSIDRIVIYVDFNTIDHYSDNFLTSRRNTWPNYHYFGSTSTYNNINPYVSIKVKNYLNTTIFTAYTNNFNEIYNGMYTESKRYNDLTEKRKSWG